MTQPNLISLAKQGDTRALTNLLNRSLQARGIVAKATRREGTLHVLLEAETPPSQGASVRCIQQGLEKLDLVDTPVTIYGRQQGTTKITWQEHLDAPINQFSSDQFSPDPGNPFESSIDAPLSEGFDKPELTTGEPTKASVDWSDQATAIESIEPLPTPPPPPGVIPNRGESTANSRSWDDFDLNEAGYSGAAPASMPSDPAYGEVEAGWGGEFTQEYSPELLEPTLIVNDEGEDELETPLSDEDADSEILLSLWDDANLEEDDLEDPSAEVSVGNLNLWQGDNATPQEAESTVLSDNPMVVGEPSGRRNKGDRQRSALPLLLLGLLAIVGGIAAAAWLNPTWLAQVPGVGPLLATKDGSSGQETEPSPSDSDAPPVVQQKASPPTTEGSASNSPEGSTAPENPEPPTSEATPVPGVTVEPFRDAVNAAMQAANLAQVASSADEWRLVADFWEQAVKNMQAVPADHPRYETAQQKISEYQRNLEYAQQRMNN